MADAAQGRSAADGMNSPTTAVLYSGGLDSGILLADLAARGRVVPVYVDCGLTWQAAERAAAMAFSRRVARDLPVADPVVLALPVADLYGDHWSLSGRDVPAYDSPDSAVYLPGRNALLAVKPLVWCAGHGVRRLALATLGGNPFPDATADFFRVFSRAMSLALGQEVEVQAPFATCSKRDVMLRGRSLPLEATFSCISPAATSDGSIHCGRCNKCAERRRAFAAAGLPDATPYAASPDCGNPPECRVG